MSYESLLAIIYQPNPPKLLMVEEPGNGIHSPFPQICGLAYHNA